MIYLAFLLGIFAGSFLNVVIYRLKAYQKAGGAAKNIIFGRSFCPECKIQLQWRDLMPIASFICLHKRCRYCNKRISWQYPIVETLSGIIWMGVFYKNFYNNFQFSIFNLQFLNFFYYIFIFSALLVVAVYDYKWQIIPDKIVFPAIIVVLTYNIINYIIVNANFITPIIVSLIAFLFFFLIFYFSKGQAMGFGDAKLAFLIGLFLSPLLSITAFALAFIIGALFGIILLVFTDKTLKSQIAFGPFLIFGAFTAFFFSDFITKLYVLYLV